MQISAEARAQIESSIDLIVENFATLVLLHRNAGKPEQELTALFDCAVTPPVSSDIPPDVAESIRLLAYEKLHARLDELMAHVVIPENYSLH